jgi:hypothetical protein
VEPLTLIVRRFERLRKPTESYNPLDFHYAYLLSSIDDEPMLVREVVDST